MTPEQFAELIDVLTGIRSNILLLVFVVALGVGAKIGKK